MRCFDSICAELKQYVGYLVQYKDMFYFNYKKLNYIFLERSFEGGGGFVSDNFENGMEEQDLPELTEEEMEAIKAAQKAAEEEMMKLAQAGFGEKLVRSEGIEVQGREEVTEALRKAIEEVRKGE